MSYKLQQVREYKTGLTQRHTLDAIEGDAKQECIDLMRRVRARGNASDLTVVANGITFTETTVLGPCQVTITYEGMAQ